MVKRQALITLIAVGALSAPALAQSGSGGGARGQCRDCAQGHDSTRISYRRRDVAEEIEALASQVVAMRESESQLRQEMSRLVARARATSEEDKDARATIVRRYSEQVSQLGGIVRQQRELAGRLRAMCAGRVQPTGWMGVVFSGNVAISKLNDGPEIFRFDGYPAVETVEPGSPAEAAGLRTGDVIVAFDEGDIRDRDIVFSEVLKPGAKLPLRLRRNGRAFDVMLIVGRRPQVFENQCPLLNERLSAALADAPGQARAFARTIPTPRAEMVPMPPQTPGGTVVPMPTPPSAMVVPAAPSIIMRSVTAAIAGAELVRMNQGLSEAFGVDRGVLVLSVARGTPAEEAGLKPGDVLLQADRLAISTPSQLQRALEQSDDRSVELRIVRKKKTQTLRLSW